MPEPQSENLDARYLAAGRLFKMEREQEITRGDRVHVVLKKPTNEEGIKEFDARYIGESGAYTFKFDTGPDSAGFKVAMQVFDATEIESFRKIKK